MPGSDRRHLHLALRARRRGDLALARRLLMQGIVVARERGSDALPLRMTLTTLLRREAWREPLLAVRERALGDLRASERVTFG